MSTKYDQQVEGDKSRSGSNEPDGSSLRTLWNWFGATFGIVVLVGGLLFYLAGRGDPSAVDSTLTPDRPTATEPADESPNVTADPVPEAESTSEDPADQPPAPSTGQTSSVVLGIYVVDSFGFHAMEEAYTEATEVGERDAGQVAKVLAAVDAVDWPAELSEAATVFRGDLEGLVAALEAGDLEGARAGFEAVHGSQHDLSNGVYAWLGSAPPDGSTSSVVLGIYVVDSFGFHVMEEAYAEATEVGERDAGQVAKVLAAVDAVDWPAELSEAATVFRGDLEGLVTALEAGDLEGARAGFEAVHGSQHDLSNGVYAWMAGEPMETHGDQAPPADQTMEIIEVDMFEFGYAPEGIDIQAGIPVILRFTNSGKLEHEAMVGDIHMHEEWAEASGSGGHDPRDGHHGDLMAVTVLPGETQDLEVLIEQPGTWYMACHLVGHYESGQIATINVSA